ncbi:hypothetical protein J6590_102393 [Homalodisca vitripennis]|nr:hypothetical protein J6590_102393 [Homalodisca vitripennis]
MKALRRRRDQMVDITQTVNGKSVTTRSDKLPMNRGVPQGSVLRPVLFVLFTADFPAYTGPSCNTIMYVDDTVLITASRDTEELEVQS